MALKLLRVLRNNHLLRNGRPFCRCHDDEIKRLAENTIPKYGEKAAKFVHKLFQAIIPFCNRIELCFVWKFPILTSAKNVKPDIRNVYNFHADYFL
jgi:hypothetical protein